MYLEQIQISIPTFHFMPELMRWCKAILAISGGLSKRELRITKRSHQRIEGFNEFKILKDNFIRFNL